MSKWDIRGDPLLKNYGIERERERERDVHMYMYTIYSTHYNGPMM